VTPAPTPVRAIDPVELRLARSAALFLVVLGLPVIAIAGIAVGPEGAASAAIGAAVVIGMFLMAGSTMSWAARISPAALMGAVLGCYLVRLFIYAALIILLRDVAWIHGRALAISTAVLLVAVLVWEVRIASRNPKLFWVDASAGQPTSPGVVETGDSRGAGAAPDATPTFVPPVERTRP
jgi:ATP synthase protein I